jgi:hypothetical protein
VPFVDHRLRLVPSRHVFQATYSEVRGKGVRPVAADPRPLFHHWVHAWIGHPFDIKAWVDDWLDAFTIRTTTGT